MFNLVDIKETKVYQEAFQEGKDEGWGQGRDEGWGQGRDEGWDQGRDEGWDQGIQQGMQQGIIKSIEIDLADRFGLAGLRILPEIKKIKDTDVLEAIFIGLRKVQNAEELRQIYAQ